MRTASSRDVYGRFERIIRPGDRSYVASETRRFTRKGWPFDWLALALSALLVGATAVCGLAVVSRRVPPPAALIVDGLLRGDRGVSADSLRVPGGLPCCDETP